MKNTKYKIILGSSILFVTAIYIALLIGKNQSKEEVFNYYIKESILNEADTLYVLMDDTEDGQKKYFKLINIQAENPYYIRVNCKAQTVTIYKKDENGYYNIPYKVMICSTGTSTPKEGIYEMTDFKEKWLALYGGVYGKYCTQIVDNILFHSVPYFEYENSGSLEYMEYDKLGSIASLGCVRLKVEDAKWIFDNCDLGTLVEFYEEENPGPLGKPNIEKISNYKNLRNWDPTDEEDSNPWLKYYEEKETNERRMITINKTINEIKEITKLNDMEF